MCKIYTEVGWKYISLDYIRNQDLHQSKQINMNSNNSNSDKKKKEKNAFLSKKSFYSYRSRFWTLK